MVEVIHAFPGLGVGSHHDEDNAGGHAGDDPEHGEDQPSQDQVLFLSTGPNQKLKQRKVVTPDVF